MTATTNTADFAAMGKEALRQAMRDAGLSYAKLNNDGMRAALVTATATGSVEQEVTPAAVPAPNMFATMFNRSVPVGVLKGTNVTTVVDGKRVDPTAPAVKEERKPRARIEKAPAPVVPRPSLKGMKVQKEREVRNGVKRHSEGTVCDNIWLAFDANPAIKAGELQALADANGWNRTNVACEFYAWRKFNGISGRAAK
jgi:hypothetical protein